MLDRFYRYVAKPMLFRLDAEAVHHMILTILSHTPSMAPWPDLPALNLNLWGIEFSNPIGLAAGMDKDAVAVHAWHSLGFGFAELGTVTPRPQPGNSGKRIFRVPERGALINRLGFPGEGMEAVAERLQRLRHGRVPIRIGINLGPNKDTPPEGVAADYAALMNRLGSCADFVVINVSSPNTPGLRNWQSPERMREIYAAVTGGQATALPPILVKLAPDLERTELLKICDTAVELGFDGIVATNTTLRRKDLGIASDYEGGLSGRPLLELARGIIADIYRHTGGRIPIVGVGGVASAEDAYGHIRAGASIVELYTGLIYEGPGLVAAIKVGLAGLLRRDGFGSINEAIGTAVRT
jgi:dihydroorotate dehydrogenase